MPVRLAVALSMLALWIAGPALADLGPLRGLVLEGEDPPWHGTVTADGYVLSNIIDAVGLEYVYLPAQPGEEGRRAITAAVRVEPESEGAGAGILYGYRPDPRFFYAILVQAPGRLVVLRRGPKGFEMLASSAADLVPSAANEILVIERDAAIEVRLNGAHVVAIAGEGMGEGAVGIIALGSGRFTFARFALELAEAAAADVAEPAPVADADTDDGGIAAVVALVRAQLLRGSPDAPGPPPLGWQRYADPGFGVVSLDHPPGWQVQGTSRLLSPGVLGEAHVRAASPDGERLFDGRTVKIGEAEGAQAHAERLLAELGARLPLGPTLREERWRTLSAGEPGAALPEVTTRSEWLVRALAADGRRVVLVVGVRALEAAGGSLHDVAHRLIVGPADGFDQDARAIYLPMLASTLHW